MLSPPRTSGSSDIDRTRLRRYARAHARGRRAPPRRPAAAGAGRASGSRSRRRIRARRRPGSRSGWTASSSSGVEAVGKNLLLRFEGGVVLRSHLRMRGRWRVGPRGTPPRAGRGSCCAASELRGGALERARARARTPARCGGSGPTSSPAARPRRDGGAAARAAPRIARSATRCSTSGSSRGSGTCGRPRRSGGRSVSPWRPLGDVGDDELRARARRSGAADARVASTGSRAPRRVYRRAGRPCPRCGEPRSVRAARATTTGRVLVPALPAGRERTCADRRRRKERR